MVSERLPLLKRLGSDSPTDVPPIRKDEESVTFLDLKHGQTVVAAIPHTDASAYHFMVLTPNVQYSHNQTCSLYAAENQRRRRVRHHIRARGHQDVAA